MEDLVIEPMTASIGDDDFDDDEDLDPLSFDFDTIEEEPDFCSRLQIILARIKSTRTCFVIYISMTLICASIFIAAASGIRGASFLAAEVTINILLVLEVVSDIITERAQYFAKIGNWMDLIVTMACVVFFIMEEARDRQAYGNIPALNAVVLGIRYSFQLFRAFLCAVRGHSTMQMIAQDEVEVHDLELKNMVRMNGQGVRHHRVDDDDDLEDTDDGFGHDDSHEEEQDMAHGHASNLISNAISEMKRGGLPSRLRVDSESSFER
mmetsp:Transcript_20991/g.33967  ORF Transcript_20991/g.33967 Transcript_20991/m.33967 type:complete len:266 (+) Transcript_20991:127-924(+)